MDKVDFSSQLYNAPAGALRACADFERHLRKCDRSAAIKLAQDVNDIRDPWAVALTHARAVGDVDMERKALGTVAALDDFLHQVRRQIAAPYYARFPETLDMKEAR